MKNFLKSKKGITLIALVITIVVLIILATVVINLSLSDNGIFNRAKTATQEYSNAQNYEETEIGKVTNEINSIVGNRDMNENRIREIIREELNNKSFLTYPSGTPIQLDSSTGALSSQKSISAPGDGWIVLKTVNNHDTGVHYRLWVGVLYSGGSDGYTNLNVGASLPCKKGENISYQWWGNSCAGGSLTFIPQE